MAQLPSHNLQVVVMTYNTSTNEMKDQPKFIDYGSSRARKWLASHTLWALNNGHSVETMNAKDYRRLNARDEA